MKLMLVAATSMLERDAIPGGSSVLDELILLCDSISLQEKMLSSRHLTPKVGSFWRIRNIWRIVIMEIHLEIFFGKNKSDINYNANISFQRLSPENFILVLEIPA